MRKKYQFNVENKATLTLSEAHVFSHNSAVNKFFFPLVQ